MKAFYSILGILLISLNLYSQKKDDNVYSQNPRFMIHLGSGITRGFDKFEQAEPNNSDFVPFGEFNQNLEVGIQIFHKNRWFSTYNFSYFDPRYGVTATIYGDDDDSIYI